MSCKKEPTQVAWPLDTIDKKAAGERSRRMRVVQRGRGPSRRASPGALASRCTGLTVLLWSAVLVLAATAQEVRIESIQSADRTVVLHWQGATNPCQIRYSTDLTNWSDFDRPVATNMAVLPAPAPATVYRVQSLGHAGLGRHVGQLRVLEGEFGDAMARHRLKSIWDFHLPPGAFDPPTPAAYFRGLIVRWQFVEGTNIRTLVGPLESFPESSVAVAPRTLTFRWRLGAGDQRRDFELELGFGYDITVARARPLLSDPSYALSCTYAVAQPVLVDDKVGLTQQDAVALGEIPDSGGDPFPGHHELTVRGKTATVGTAYTVGRHYLEGELPWIYKTFVLLGWDQPTVISNLTPLPFELRSRYSQTYVPSHHNFVETFVLEPQLEPGVDPAVLAALREQDIRLIVATNPTAFPEEPSSIRLVGFDGSIRSD